MIAQQARWGRSPSLPHETVYDVLGAWGRAAHPAVLAVAGALALLGGEAIAAFAPHWSLAATPLLTVASFSAWGLAAQQLDVLDRRVLPARERRRRVLRVLKLAAAGLGTVTAVVAFYAAFLLLLGPSWKL